MTDLTGKTCLITGANTGIGLETARAIAGMGATVVMGARDPEKGAAAVEDVRQSTGSERVEALHLDLGSRASIEAATDVFRARHDALHILINNAGAILARRQLTQDGFEAQFGVNHLGHFLLTTRLLDLLKASAPARVVNLSSDAHRASRGLNWDDLQREQGYTMWGGYNDSKLANVLFTRELARRLDGTGVTANAVHPGVVNTRFAKDGDGGWFMGWVMKLSGPLLTTPAKGARTSIHVATAPEAQTITGEYWKSSKVAKASGPARDDAAAERLWRVSEALWGLTSTG